MRIIPCTLKDANEFVSTYHRHHGRVVGYRFAVACAVEDVIVGVSIVSRPVARMSDDGLTAEVTRLATDGTKNACSMLYAASWRAARAMGYRRMITYTLEDEPGTSLRAAGWRLIGEAGGGSWSRPSRPREDSHPLQGKLRWEAA